MPQYEVTVRQIEIYTIKVEAENEKSAELKALDIFDSAEENERFQYHNDSDTETKVFEINGE